METFPEGFEGFTCGKHCLVQVDQLHHWFVDPYNTPSDSIVVKSVLYGKQTNGAELEFIIIQVEDTNIPGLINYLALNCDVQGPLGRPPMAQNTFQISPDGGIKMLLEEFGLQPCSFLEQISFQSDTPLHLYELATLADVVSKAYFWYSHFNCNSFAGIIWECIRLARPSATHQDNLPQEQGGFSRTRYFPDATRVRKLYKTFTKMLPVVNPELQQRRKVSKLPDLLRVNITYVPRDSWR